MNIKETLAAIFADGKFNIDAFIAALELGFVAAEEGYDFPAAE